MKDTHVILEAEQIKVLEDKIIQAIKIIKSAKLATSFDPSMKTLMRIVEFMTENYSEGKTQMALDTKLNYTRLAKHIVWMEEKGLAKSIIEDRKINIVLTTTGKDFAKIILKTI